MPLNYNEAARLLNAQWAGTAYTAPTAHSLSLHTANSGSSDTVTAEVTGGSYARQNFSCAAITATGLTSAPTGVVNSGAISYTMPAATVTNAVAWNGAAGSGTPQANGLVSPSVTTTAGQTLTFAAGSLTISLA